MADVDVPGPSDGRPEPGPRRRMRRRRRAGQQPPLESLEERESRRSDRARQAAAIAEGGPWQWQWRRQHRRRRTVGCMLWIVTLLAVLLVLALLFGGFQRGHKVGSTGPAGPVPASSAPRPAPVAGSVS
jgi:hypothetical protein